MDSSRCTSDQVRVQPGEHGEAADHALGRDAQRHRTGQPPQVTSATGPGRVAVEQGADEGEDGDDDQHEGEQPVAELDGPVHPELGMGDEGVLGAARPGGAAESGPGQPDQAAGDHNPDVAHQGCDGPPRERPRTPNQARQIHRNAFRATSTPAVSQPSKIRIGQPSATPEAAARRPSPSAAVGSAWTMG